MGTINIDKIELVKRLYYKDKLSIQGVADRLNVSIDAVVYFMRKNSLARRKPYESNLIRYERSEPSFQLRKLDKISLKNLKIIGTMLYWGEGHKAGKTTVDFANSDKDMIRLFLRFLREVCGVDEKKLRVYPYFYANQNIEKCINFWSEITGINKSQFTKPYIRKDFDGSKTHKMAHGLIHVRYSDKKLLNLIKDWIEEYKQKY